MSPRRRFRAVAAGGECPRDANGRPLTGHGTESGYRRGCRGDLCRAAATKAREDRLARQRLRDEREDLDRRRERMQALEAVPGSTVELDEAEAGLWYEYDAARRRRDELDAHILRMELELKEKIGTAETLRVRGRVVAFWSYIPLPRFDERSFRKDHPAMFNRYVVDRGSRRFRLARLARRKPPAGEARDAKRSAA